MPYRKNSEFQPDYTHVENAARNQWQQRLPLYEHIIGGKVMQETMGQSPYDLMYAEDMKDGLEGFSQYWNFWKSMGYDTASMEFCICGVLPDGGALGSHKKGVIQTREDFEKYPWDEIPDMFFARFAPYMQRLMQTCPPGMKAVGGVGNGVFECVQDLVGYEDLCYMRSDDEALYADLFNRMGAVQSVIWQRFMDEYADVYCVLRFGDDLGFNTATLLPTDDIRKYIIPQYRRITDIVHQSGKPFLLHSCGNLFSVFDEIITDGRIDAKHSNEDTIAHFSEWVNRYGDRIGNFGGVDVNVLCLQSPEDIRLYVLDCLERIQGHGGIAFGSGNSIPDYVPTEGYLAMIETVREWRTDKRQ